MRKLIIFNLTMLSALLAAQTASAAPGKLNGRSPARQHHYDQDLPAETGPSLNGGDEFKIDKYDENAKMYVLTYFNDPTSENLFASPEDLAKAVSGIDLRAILENPESIAPPKHKDDEPEPPPVWYHVDRDKELRLLRDDEVESRRRHK